MYNNKNKGKQKHKKITKIKLPMKNVMFVLVIFAMFTLVACNHNNSADVTKKGKVPDTIKGIPTLTNTQIHNNSSNVSTGGVILNSTPVKIINSKMYGNLSDADINKIMYQAGVSAMSQWGPSNTGVTYSHKEEEPMDVDSLRHYFSTLRYIKKSSYTRTQWDSMLVADLQSGRPTYYRDDHVWPYNNLNYHSIWPAEPMTRAFRRYFEDEAAKKNQWNPFAELPEYQINGDSTLAKLDSMLKAELSTFRYIKKTDYTHSQWDSFFKADPLRSRPYYHGDGTITHY